MDRWQWILVVLLVAGSFAALLANRFPALLLPQRELEARDRLHTAVSDRTLCVLDRAAVVGGRPSV